MSNKLFLVDAGASHLTYTLDGWSNARMEAIYAHMLVTEARTAHYLKSEDLSLERHTGEYIGGDDVVLTSQCFSPAVGSFSKVLLDIPIQNVQASGCILCRAHQSRSESSGAGEGRSPSMRQCQQYGVCPQ